MTISEEVMTGFPSFRRAIIRLICRWKGHTFTLPNRENFSGGIIALVGVDTACSRCKRTFADLWNDGEVPR